MSHYAVAVFADTPDDFDRLLDPYDENKHETRHVVDKDALSEKYKQFLKQNPSWEKLGYEYYLKEMGYMREGDEIVSYYNDNAKYDYYVLDGRSYLFDLVKEPQLYNRKNDYSYDDPEQEECDESAAEFWDKYVVQRDQGDYYPFYTAEHYIERYGTKEQYIKEMCFNGPYAFVTPDGVWHSPGKVGFFAQDDATTETKNAYMKEWNDFIQSDSNPYVSFVDCHI